MAAWFAMVACWFWAFMLWVELSDISKHLRRIATELRKLNEKD